MPIILQAICVAWFTAEYVWRWFVARDKSKFMRKAVNVVDVVSSFADCNAARVPRRVVAARAVSSPPSCHSHRCTFAPAQIAILPFYIGLFIDNGAVSGVMRTCAC